MDALVAAAKQEGQLTVIALPHDWCGYGDVIANFQKKYGLKINELNPDAGSGDEVEAIKANKDNKGPQAPDVIDVGLSFGPSAKNDKLVQPYKVATWDSIPADAKDAEGYWYGDYYGVLAFQINADIVKNLPQDWNDLLKPEYKGQVALAGDPRGSNQAIQAVNAAALANGGSFEDPTAGLNFFKQLYTEGNFVPVIAKAATVVKGMDDQLAQIAATAAKATTKPRVYWELDATDPAKPYTPGPGSFIDDIITLSGGANVAASAKSAYTQINAEEVIAANPEIIILSDAAYGISVESVKARKGWSVIPAVKNDKAFPIDDNLVSRPGPRIIDGLEAAAKLIHPEVFK